MNIQQTQPDHKPDDLDFSPDDILALATAAEDDWQEPEQFLNALLPVEPLIPELVPEPLRAYVFDEAERMSCPADFIFAALTVSIGTIVGTTCGIRPKQFDSWLVVPNLWGAIIAQPGSMKTNALRAGTRFITEIESLARKEHTDSERRFKAELAAFAAERSGIEGAMKEAAKKKKSSSKYSNQDASDMELLKDRHASLAEPSPPKQLRLQTSEGTLEKSHELMANNPRGILNLRDELVGILCTLAHPDREADKAFYLEAWNGTGSFTVDRIGRGTVHAERLCLSMFGNIQPDRLRKGFDKLFGGGDGLVQRFQLIVFPDEAQYKKCDRKPNSGALERVRNLITILAKSPFTVWGASRDGIDEIPFIRFSADAQQVFDDWYSDLRTTKLKMKEDSIQIEHWAKYASLIPKLALLNELIDRADCCTDQKLEVSVAAITLAIAQAEYFESHTRRMYGLVIGGMTEAHRLAMRILAGDVDDEFTPRDLMRKQWSGLSSNEQIEDACKILVVKGWLKRQRRAAGNQGGRPSVVFAINPKVFKWEDSSSS
jgi:putative DNA primase/helicase